MTKAEILNEIMKRVGGVTGAWEHPIDATLELRVGRTGPATWRVSVRRRGSITGDWGVLISRLAHSAERAATVARWMLTKYAPEPSPVVEPTKVLPLREAATACLAALDAVRALDMPQIDRKLRGKARERVRAARAKELAAAGEALRAALNPPAVGTAPRYAAETLTDFDVHKALEHCSPYSEDPFIRGVRRQCLVALNINAPAPSIAMAKRTIAMFLNDLPKEQPGARAR